MGKAFASASRRIITNYDDLSASVPARQDADGGGGVPARDPDGDPTPGALGALGQTQVPLFSRCCMVVQFADLLNENAKCSRVKYL
jgi:hypothetical protein